MPSELNGIVVVDKPGGISSAGVVAKVKRVFGAKKVGHTGTLDPFATGVLICCLNKATRLSRFFLDGDKAYEAVMTLGVSTDTQDATGSVVEERQLDGIAENTVHAVASRFVGPIKQVPPAYSALKHRGTPLYKLARQGKMVEKPARSVQIYELKLLEVKLPAVRFFVSCSSGTYIRTLCSDMGKEMGCGAHLAQLRRVAVSGFTIDDATELEPLMQQEGSERLQAFVIPMSEALPFMPAAVAEPNVVEKIQNGIKLYQNDLTPPDRSRVPGAFKVIDQSGCLIAVLSPSMTRDRYDYCCVFKM